MGGDRVAGRLRERGGDAEKVLTEFVKLQPGQLYVCLEEGTQAGWLVELLSPHVAEVVLGIRLHRTAHDGHVGPQRIPSLRGYLMVDTESQRLELYARADADATWTYGQALPGEAIQLPVGGARLAVDDVYRDPSVGG